MAVLWETGESVTIRTHAYVLTCNSNVAPSRAARNRQVLVIRGWYELPIPLSSTLIAYQLSFYFFIFTFLKNIEAVLISKLNRQEVLSSVISTLIFISALQLPYAVLKIMADLPATYVEGFHDLSAVRRMEYRPLGKTGLMISKLSFGGGPLGCHYGTYDEDDAIATIREAIRKGINYIDTAPWYGQGRSEETIGKALEGIPRRAYYIATKVGRYELDFEHMFDFSAEKVRKNFQKSLKLLKLDYVDVLQAHDIEFAPSLDIIITQTLPEISKQVSLGKAKFIGITGYPVSVLRECVEKSNINISLILSYSRYTLIDDTLLEYLPFFKEKNIGIINAAAPCMGLLTNQGPPDWHPASKETKEECRNAAKYCDDHDLKLAKLAIWYAMQNKDIATNLIGMQNSEQLKMNLDILYNGITDEEKETLKEIQQSHCFSETHVENRVHRILTVLAERNKYPGYAYY